MTADWHGQALVIVPTYNEKESITRLVGQIRGLAGDIHVLVVDDNSPDGTGGLVDGLAGADTGIHVLHRAGKLGLGTAYKAGFAFGLARPYQFLCTMDADFSHSPESLPALLAKASTGYDLVVGSRYVPGGGVEGWPTSRKILSAGANLLAHLLLGVSIRDCTAGFRCYQRHVLEAIDLDAIFSSGYSFLMEMAFYVQRAGFRCGEVPITFVNRTEGSSKISKTEIYKAFYTLLRLRTRALPWEWAVGKLRRKEAIGE
ncbi:MAG: polyprenol monophosphomannose synthase [Caldilineaceae bacterium]|nr:polyprenol monophosphomannose synthase [Caldilineaceae bacterium]